MLLLLTAVISCGSGPQGNNKETEADSSVVALNGQLQVIGTQLSNEQGEPLLLRGASLGWHNLWPRFYNEGAVNFPYLSDGMWFLTQHKRWGLLKSHPDYLGVAKQINQTALYKEVASAMKINVPKSDLRTSKLIDGVVWDGKDPAKYADGFKIKA